MEIAPDLEHYVDVDTFEMRSLLRKFQAVTVRHHQNCTCGRTLVNTYYRDPGTMATNQERKDAWKCKKCWDKIDRDTSAVEIKRQWDEQYKPKEEEA